MGTKVCGVLEVTERKSICNPFLESGNQILYIKNLYNPLQFSPWRQAQPHGGNNSKEAVSAYREPKEFTVFSAIAPSRIAIDVNKDKGFNVVDNRLQAQASTVNIRSKRPTDAQAVGARLFLLDPPWLPLPFLYLNKVADQLRPLDPGFDLDLAHVDPERAFAKYAAHYLATSGQIYWSDTHQLSLYVDHYHRWLDKQLDATEKATEMITEVYVTKDALVRFMEDVRKDFRAHRVEIIYGTIRLIERDDESFLAWAKEPYACVIFNLHTVHSPAGLKRSARAFRRLIDLAIRYGGSYYLTYHRFATRRQVEACYPQFPEFLLLKRKHDPEERFQSDWYRHYRLMFADVLQSSSDR